MPRRKKKDYPGHITQRGDAWRVTLRVAGERHTYTVHAEGREAVEEFCRQERDKLKGRAVRVRLGLPGSMSVADLLTKFEADRLPTLAERTQKSYKATLARFREFQNERAPSIRVEEVRPGHIKEFLSWRQLHRVRGEGALSNRTLQKDRSLLHGVFSFAEELELREGNPVARVKAPKVTGRDPVLLTPPQLAALLAECSHNDMLHLYVLTLAEAGLRADSEAMRIKWADVDLEGGFLWVPSTKEHPTKSKRGRWVPLQPRLRSALREHFARYRLASYGGKRSAYLFHHTRTRKRAQAGERIRSFRNAFEKAAERAKLPEGFNRHDLRHLRATSWLAAGANVHHVQEALGHSAIQTTLGYVHLAREHLRSLVPEEEGREKLRDLQG